MNNGGIISYDDFYKITVEVQESIEDYVFSIIYPFIERTTNLKVNKKLLTNAILEYYANHPKEFDNYEIRD